MLLFLFIGRDQVPGYTTRRLPGIDVLPSDAKAMMRAKAKKNKDMHLGGDEGVGVGGSGGGRGCGGSGGGGRDGSGGTCRGEKVEEEAVTPAAGILPNQYRIVATGIASAAGGIC